MKINLGTEFMTNVQDTSVDINIDAEATSDDGQTVILKRTLTYAVNTINEGWRDLVITRLTEQALEFKNDSQKLVDLMNRISNISSDIVI